MKKNLFVLMIMIFLIIMIANNSSAFYLWEKFGNNLTTYTQTQDSNAVGDFSGTIQYYNSTISGGRQVLMAHFGENDSHVIISGSDGLLKILDSGFQQVTQINSSLSLTNLDLTDFDNDGVVDDVVGIFQTNSSTASFRVYSYNGTLSLIREQNFSPVKSYSGLRCRDINCYFLETNLSGKSLVNVNSSSYSKSSLFGDSYGLNEPFAIDDYDGDGNLELYGWTVNNFFSLSLNGNREFFMSRSNFTGIGLSITAGSKPIYYGGSWKYLISVEGSGLCGTGGVAFYVKNVSGGSEWNKLLFCGASSMDSLASSGIAINDYNGDSIPDIYTMITVIKGSPSTNHTSHYMIVSGNNGTVLYEKYTPAIIQTTSLGNVQYPNTMLTLARVGNFTTPEFILNTKYNHAIFSPSSNSYIINNTYFSSQVYSCIPADLDKDNKQEVICSFNGLTKIYGNNGTLENRNPVVNSITLSRYPAIVDEALIIIISATDDLNATINYTYSCDGEPSSTPTINNTYICYYGSDGYHNFSVGVKDSSHSYFDYYFADILATTDGDFCNLNGICEAWENNTTCYTDCSGKYTTATGGTPLPLTLVDIENENEGLLPEIYSGMSAFLGYIIEPLIIIIFLIFIVLIGFALSSIIAKFGNGLLR